MRGEPIVGTADRQKTILSTVKQAVAERAWLDAMLLIGSLADDSADALSDIDLLVVVHEGQFTEAWSERDCLRATGALCMWDQRADERAEVGAHKWLTPDLVLVEALISTPSSGVRLAEPWVIVAGDEHAPARMTRRPRIERREMGVGEAHPVEAAYDDLKNRVRRLHL